MSSLDESQTSAAVQPDDALSDQTPDQSTTLNRRDALKAGLVAGAALAAAPVIRVGSTAAAGFQGTITFFAQAYTPTKSMVLSSTNATPRHNMALVVAAWEKMHPGVNIQFVNGPVGDYYIWARTVLTGETAPNVMWWQTDAKFTDENKVVQLDSWLEKPNPYNNAAGNPDRSIAWMDTFQPPYKIVAATPNHHYGWVPMDVVSTGVYYNKDILSKVGLNANNYAPATWAQWMRDLALIKSKGIIPFGSAYVPLQWWAYGALSPELLWPDVAKYGVLKYQPNTVPGTVDEEDMVRAVLREGWLPSKDPGVSQLLQVMKAWVPYWYSGWAIQNYSRDYQLFVNSQMAFMWEGTWTDAQLKNDPLRKFAYGTFWLPPVTSATSSAVHNPPIKPVGVGGYGSLNYCVTKSAVNNGSVDLCVDFLQYLTTPNNDSLVVNEEPQFVVAVKGAPDKSGLGHFFAGEKALVNGYAHTIELSGLLGSTWQTKFFEITVEYYQGQIDLNGCLQQLDQVAKTQAQSELLLNDKTKNKLGTWDTSKW